MIGEAERNVLDAYLRLFDCPDGELVLADLSRSFAMRLGEADADVEDIPHPYRAYHIDGQRYVVDKIIATMQLARDLPLTIEG